MSPKIHPSATVFQEYCATHPLLKPLLPEVKKTAESISYECSSSAIFGKIVPPLIKQYSTQCQTQESGALFDPEYRNTRAKIKAFFEAGSIASRSSGYQYVINKSKISDFRSAMEKSSNELKARIAQAKEENGWINNRTSPIHLLIRQLLSTKSPSTYLHISYHRFVSVLHAMPWQQSPEDIELLQILNNEEVNLFLKNINYHALFNELSSEIIENLQPAYAQDSIYSEAILNGFKQTLNKSLFLDLKLKFSNILHPREQARVFSELQSSRYATHYMLNAFYESMQPNVKISLQFDVSTQNLQENTAKEAVQKYVTEFSEASSPSAQEQFLEVFRTLSPANRVLALTFFKREYKGLLSAKSFQDAIALCMEEYTDYFNHMTKPRLYPLELQDEPTEMSSEEVEAFLSAEGNDWTPLRLQRNITAIEDAAIAKLEPLLKTFKQESANGFDRLYDSNCFSTRAKIKQIFSKFKELNSKKMIPLKASYKEIADELNLKIKIYKFENGWFIAQNDAVDVFIADRLKQQDPAVYWQLNYSVFKKAINQLMKTPFKLSHPEKEATDFLLNDSINSLLRGNLFKKLVKEQINNGFQSKKDKQCLEKIKKACVDFIDYGGLVGLFDDFTEILSPQLKTTAFQAVQQSPHASLEMIEIFYDELPKKVKKVLPKENLQTQQSKNQLSEYVAGFKRQPKSKHLNAFMEEFNKLSMIDRAIALQPLSNKYPYIFECKTFKRAVKPSLQNITL